VVARENLSAIVAGLSAAAILLGAPTDAAACSCLPLDPWDAYARSDAAFVGVYEGKRSPTTYRFTVEKAYKADLPRELDVESAEHGAACGIETRAGERLGLFLSRAGTAWRSNLCSQARPEHVRIAAAGLPEPNGRGSVSFLVGGRFGPARVQALDARGRTLAYGFGDGTANALAVCPGARVAVEVTSGGILAARDLRTLRLLRELSLGLRPHEFPSAVACPDRAARTTYVFAWRAATGRIIRVRGRRQTSIFRGAGVEAGFAPGFAYVAGRRRGVTSVELATGRRRVVSRLPADLAAPSPDRRYLAALTDRGRLAVVDLASRRARLGPPAAAPTRPVWVDSRRVAWVEDSGRVRLYDTAFRRLGGFRGWRAGATIAANGRLVGAASGTLQTARLPRGPVRILRDLISPNTLAIAAVRSGPRIRLAASLRCARG
jgi:hypothetical protein